jgi:hypothetical protein
MRFAVPLLTKEGIARLALGEPRRREVWRVVNINSLINIAYFTRHGTSPPPLLRKERGFIAKCISSIVYKKRRQSVDCLFECELNKKRFLIIS